jgi:hypothetical protein
MYGYFAALAAAALAETEAQLQQEAAERQAAGQVERFDNIARRLREADQRNVIDVEAREVPEAPALPPPARKESQ